MKSCANCEWSISPELEEAIMEEQRYKEDDPDRPHAGDCCLGMDHGKNYICDAHTFICGMEEYENYVFYDDQYLGPGYIIISKLDEEIVRFMKISSYGEGGMPTFLIRGFEKDSIDKDDDILRKIYFSIQKNDPLYDLISELSRTTVSKRIYSIDSSVQGEKYFQATCNADEANLILAKDAYGVKHATDFIDILIGDNYFELMKFYKKLSELSAGETKEEDIQKILTIKNN
jgi:hypothetical protein